MNEWNNKKNTKRWQKYEISFFFCKICNCFLLQQNCSFIFINFLPFFFFFIFLFWINRNVWLWYLSFFRFVFVLLLLFLSAIEKKEIIHKIKSLNYEEKKKNVIEQKFVWGQTLWRMQEIWGRCRNFFVYYKFVCLSALCGLCTLQVERYIEVLGVGNLHKTTFRGEIASVIPLKPKSFSIIILYLCLY